MTLPVILTPAAAAEFEEAVAWYENERRGLGTQFKEVVLKTIEAVQRHPRAYPRIYRRLRRARVKRFPYSVMYTIEPLSIRVIAVFHARRDPGEWVSRVQGAT
jgi:plasmid stabilization system protein ParE